MNLPDPPRRLERSGAADEVYRLSGRHEVQEENSPISTRGEQVHLSAISCQNYYGFSGSRDWSLLTPDGLLHCRVRSSERKIITPIVHSRMPYEGFVYADQSTASGK